VRNLLVVIFALTSTTILAQTTGPLVSEFNSIRQNGVSSIAASGDTIWISPALNRNIDNEPEWFKPSGIEFIDDGDARVFSLDVKGDTIVAGLGFTSETLAGPQPAGFGYYISEDGGDNWRFSDFLLDRSIDEDTTFVYGGVTYTRKRIIVPEQSPPYNVAFKNNVIFSTNWASGLLRSPDFGNSWERVVIPPFGISELIPERDDYFWVDCLDSSSQNCEVINIYNSVRDDNLKGFSVLIDSQNRVWYGSAGGINISDNALTAPIDSIRWRNVGFNNTSNGLLARWIIEIKEDTSTGRVWMTNWLAESTGSLYEGLDRNGIVYSDDGGITFKQRLIGRRIAAITFKDGYVFAGGDDGLFISSDGGDSWIESPQIRSANAFLKSTAQFQGATSTTERVWFGTTDGLISTDDYGANWEITRVNFPLSGGNTYNEDARSVSTYAYPNPFSPNEHQIVRMRFDVEKAGNVRVRIFDFGMNLVRDVEDSFHSEGSYEALWDGIDNYGRKVANGPYFYIIETANETIDGKILLIE
jgi:hypothetical protein